jgi:uncharacterized protein (DUF1778 family)
MEIRKTTNKYPQLNTRFSEEQMDMIHAASEKLGIRRTAFLRKAAVLYAKKVVKQKPVQGFASAK